MKTVLLFDIDGTLISSGGAGRKAVERAYATLHGRADAIAAINLGGMTDRAIVRHGLTAIGVQATEPSIDALIAKYLEYLADEVTRVEEHRYVVHAGMREAIDAGRARGMAIGLGTGNVREGARIKLSRVGLHGAFDFGGYGDDHELRPELIRRGAERGAERLGVPLKDARVVVIGDTPHDVTAAHAIGAQCIGVATGGFSVAQLMAAGADWAYETLADADAMTRLLEG